MHVQVHLQSTLFMPKNKYSTKLFIYTLMHNVSTFTFVDESQTTLIIVIAMIGKSAISGGWAATQVFSAETFPTVVRLVI